VKVALDLNNRAFGPETGQSTASVWERWPREGYSLYRIAGKQTGVMKVMARKTAFNSALLLGTSRELYASKSNGMAWEKAARCLVPQ
jgi:hypothetical protein